MIITVTPNPALDLTYTLDEVRLGDTHRVAPAAVRAGGKGLNVARVVHQQGQPVLAITPTGGPSGLELTDDLVQSRIPHLMVPVQATTRRTVAFVDTGHNQTSIFNEFGENHTPAEWQALTDAVASALPNAHCLVISGSLPSGADAAFIPHLVALAHALAVPTVVDTSGPALLAAAAAGATVLKPNRQELQEATGEDDPVAAAHTLVTLGAHLVLVSLGEKGMLAVSADDSRPWRARLPVALTGNPTGAGDAAVAAAAVQLATARQADQRLGLPVGGRPVERHRIDAEAVLRTATAWSAAAVLMPLAGEISAEHPSLAAQLIVDRLAPSMPAAAEASDAAPSTTHTTLENR
ncbi:1-phosphofructokinase family hexose kinase [Glaciibacter psychrotolerans]|uniref:Carbohydrate kinase PfkB domain-containing protein n=1 Tax=Glaciibacter psychrotolerans TaxID=670054 RepID=A0A7Z0EI52_9MICO|nr:hexose kinase [Leifsonia psychrotolerans]NYJ21670.1 hypothetical protein [Leifsonia psychrotolerans]